MNEYFIQFEARIGNVWKKVIKGSDIYEAETAKQAKEMCENQYLNEIRNEFPGYYDEINFVITEVKKI